MKITENEIYGNKRLVFDFSDMKNIRLKNISMKYFKDELKDNFSEHFFTCYENKIIFEYQLLSLNSMSCLNNLIEYFNKLSNIEK